MDSNPSAGVVRPKHHWCGEKAGRDDFTSHSYFTVQTIPGNCTVPDAERRERNTTVTNEWRFTRVGPDLGHTADPHQGAKLGLVRISNDPYEASDVNVSHPDILAEMLAEAVRSRQFKPKGAMALPVPAPEGWQPPSDWSVPR